MNWFRSNNNAAPVVQATVMGQTAAQVNTVRIERGLKPIRVPKLPTNK